MWLYHKEHNLGVVWFAVEIPLVFHLDCRTVSPLIILMSLAVNLYLEWKEFPQYIYNVYLHK